MADDFEERAHEVLADRDDLHERLMAMRRAYQSKLVEMRGNLGLSAEDIDRQHHEHMMQLAELVGRDRFSAIFEHGPEEYVNLVDPETYAASLASRERRDK